MSIEKMTTCDMCLKSVKQGYRAGYPDNEFKKLTVGDRYMDLCNRCADAIIKEIGSYNDAN